MNEFEWLIAAKGEISKKSPTGTDPRSDITPHSEYFSLKEKRMTARGKEREVMVEEGSIESQSHLWNIFIDELPRILSEKCKDLEYTAWLIEALIRVYGFKGMSIGYDLASYYVSNYWSDLYPMPDEDGLETRISAIVGLNGIESEGTLIFPIASIPITEDSSEGEYTYWQYQQALDLERLDDDKKEQRIANGYPNLDKIMSATNITNNDFYIVLINDIEQAIQSFSHFTKVLDEACSEVTPSSYISKKLDDVLSAIKHLLGDRLNKLERKSTKILDGTKKPNTLEVNNTKNENILFDSINTGSREQAIHQLENIASFFRETEPHSPVSYTIEQVIRWCGMSLPELLAELISDGDAKNGYFRLVGIIDKENE